MNVRHFKKTLFIGTLCLFTILALLLLNRNCIYTPDSAEYIILAKAMISGEGYRDISTPGNPVHVKHPFFYPLILTIPVLLLSSSPILAAKITNIFLAIVALFLFRRLLLQYTHLKTPLLPVLLLALNPLFLLFATEPMAEMAYISISLLALNLINLSTKTGRISVWVLTGLAIGAACWTRSIGISLWLTALLFFFSKRLWKKGIVIGLIALFCIAGWSVRDQLIESRGGNIVYESYQTQIFISMLNPFSQHLSWATFRERIYYNACFYLRAATYLTSPFFFLNEVGIGSLISSSALLNLQQFPTLKIFVKTLILFLLATGFLSSARRKKDRLILFCFITYFIPLCIFPIRTYRLLIPLLPFLLLYLSRGIIVISNLKWFHQISTGAVWSANGLFLIAYLLIDIAMVTENLNRHWYQPTEKTITDRPSQVYDWPAAGRWIEENTAPEDIILCDRRELYLLSNRRVVGGGQYDAVFGGFEQALNSNNITFVVSELQSGIPAIHRLMAHSKKYEFEEVKQFPGVRIYRVIPRQKEVKIVKEDYSTIIEMLKQKALKFPYSVEAHSELGYFYFKEKNHMPAIEEFKKALILNPELVMNRFNLGICYLDTGHPEEAIRELRQCLKMAHSDLLFELVKSNLKIAYLLKEIDDNPANPRNYLNALQVAGLYYSQKEYNLALKQIEQAIDLRPDFADSYAFQGLCHEAKGEIKKAQEAYRKALQLDPQNKLARKHIITNTTNQKETDLP